MEPVAPKNAYDDNFVCEPSEPSERRTAMLVGIGLAGLALGIGPVARLKLAAIPTVFVISESFAIVTLALTAAICFAQFRARRYGPLAILASAFAASGLLHVAYSLTFPGVLNVSPLLIGHQTAAWLYVFSRLMPCIGATAFFLADGFERRGRHAGRGDAVTSAIAFGLLVWASILVGAFSDRLPGLVSPAGAFTPFFLHDIQPTLLLAPMVAAAFAAVTGALRLRIGTWLAILLLATFLEVFDSATLGGARFSLGWYMARLELIAGCAAVVVALHVQLAGILQRAGRASARSHALFQLSSRPGESSTEVNLALLTMAPREFGCEWGFIARVEAGQPVIELSCGNGPDERKPQDRADHLLLVAMAGGGIFDGSEAGLDRGLGGWPMFASVPLYAGGALYGAIGLASRKRGRRLTDDDRDFMHLIGLYASTAIERDLRGRRLQSLAFSDALTGLANRATIMDRIDDRIAESTRSVEAFGVYYIDLDRFKPINDRHGHAAGDEVLRIVANRLRGACGENDCVGRIGGDEFVVVRKLASAEPPELFCTRLSNALESPLATHAGTLSVGASCGVAAFPRDGRDALELLAAADAAQYRVKATRAGSSEDLPANVTRLIRPA